MILSEFWPFKQNIQNSKIQFSKFQFTFFPTVFNNLRHFLKRRFIKFGLIIVQRTVTKKIKSKWLILPPNLAPPYPIRVMFGSVPGRATTYCARSSCNTRENLNFGI